MWGLFYAYILHLFYLCLLSALSYSYFIFLNHKAMRLLFTIVIFALSLNAISQSTNYYFNPDYNGDSFIGIDDILGVLTAYDNAWSYNAEDIASGVRNWTCGDPWKHQGYWYSTVEIGEKCWFQENLRAYSFSENPYGYLEFSNEEEDWVNTTTPLCSYSIPNFDNPDQAIWNSLYVDINEERRKEKGLLYNWYAVNSDYLCPTGWHVSNYLDWSELGGTVAQTFQDISVFGTGVDNDHPYVGSTVFGHIGDELKSANFAGGHLGWPEPDFGSENSMTFANPDVNLSGFSAIASRFRTSQIDYPGWNHNLPNGILTWASSATSFNVGISAQWWIADTVITANDAQYGGLAWNFPEYQSGSEVGMIARVYESYQYDNIDDIVGVRASEKFAGYSVRCVKGCEIRPTCCDCWCIDLDVDEDGICDSVDDCISDAIGVCGGECEWDEDGDGICDEEED